MDEQDFRRLSGREEDEFLDAPDEEKQRIREQIEENPDEVKLFDIFKVLPNIREETAAHFLDLYGLAQFEKDESYQLREAQFEMLSDEQRKLYSKATKAYYKRGYPTSAKDRKEDGLLSFVLENPPKVVSRHIWRLQRNLDEPKWGTELPEYVHMNRVNVYTASVFVAICDECAAKLREEQENLAQEQSDRFDRWQPRDRYTHYSDRETGVGFYMFRLNDMWVERQRAEALFKSQFPYREPYICQVCGISDVDIWREWFGEKD